MWWLLACTESAFVPLESPPAADGHDDVVQGASGDGDAVADPGAGADYGGGYGAEMGRLAVFPADLDLETAPGCPASHAITLSNDGGAPVEVTGIDHRVGAAFSVEAPELPFVLAPGESTTFEVRFTPSAASDQGHFFGQFDVYASDALGVHSTVQHVHVAPIGEQVERFVQGPFGEVDVIVTLDETASASAARGQLAARFGDFREAMAARHVDWRMVVVTGDDGCGNEGVIAADDPDAWDHFVAAARVTAGERNYGYGDYGAQGWLAEAGLTLGRNALDQSRDGACNADLFGRSALTAMLHVSDERDQSALPWTQLVDQVFDRRPATVISAIAGDVPDGCSRATPGFGYADAAAATGGSLFSVCDDDFGFAWRALGESLAAQATIPTSVFPLRRGHPDDGTIVVVVNGDPVDNWAFDASRDAVVFDVPPPPHAIVEIAYADSGVCL